MPCTNARAEHGAAEGGDAADDDHGEDGEVLAGEERGLAERLLVVDEEAAGVRRDRTGDGERREPGADRVEGVGLGRPFVVAEGEEGAPGP